MHQAYVIDSIISVVVFWILAFFAGAFLSNLIYRVRHKTLRIKESNTAPLIVSWYIVLNWILILLVFFTQSQFIERIWIVAYYLIVTFTLIELLTVSVRISINFFKCVWYYIRQQKNG